MLKWKEHTRSYVTNKMVIAKNYSLKIHILSKSKIQDKNVTTVKSGKESDIFK